MKIEKLIGLIGILFSLNLLITGCTTATSKEKAEKVVLVEAMEAERSTMSKELYYTGIIDMGQMQKLSFKTSGIIEIIHVKQGDKVRKGQELVELDTSDIEFGLKAAKATEKAATAQYNKAVNGATNKEISQASLDVEKAKEGYDLAKQTYDHLNSLYDKGGVSKFDLDQAKTQMEIQKATYEQALSVHQQAIDGARPEDIMAASAQMEAATIDVSRYEKMIKDSILYSPFDGYVVDVLFDENEMMGAGYPVVIVRDEKLIAKVGVSQKDMHYMEIGKEVFVKSNDIQVKGIVQKIADVPDPTTMLYNIEITLEGNPFKVGSVVEVSVPIHSREGIWLPIQVIKIDDNDYVFVAIDNKAIKKNVVIEETINDYVLVSGIEVGDRIIVKGDKNLEETDKVRVVE